MLGSIMGRKLGMTSVFDDDGRVVPVTVIEAGPVTVMQVRTRDKDGYCAVQLGFLDKKLQRANKPELGLAKKTETAPKRFLAEVRVPEEEAGNYSPGQSISLSETGMEKGSFVDVSGRSMGKGYAGVMKRHGFAGAKGSHGVHEYKRHGGSIGMMADPSRVFKGKLMAGHMGNSRVTVQNLEVVEVRPEDNLLLVKGSVPGHKQGTVMLRLSKKKSKPSEAA